MTRSGETRPGAIKLATSPPALDRRRSVHSCRTTPVERVSHAQRILPLIRDSRREYRAEGLFAGGRICSVRSLHAYATRYSL
jgi:hypothetical protein